MPKRDTPRTMSTVETSWDIIHALEELAGARVIQLSDYLDIPKPTVYTHLATLREKDYVEKNGDTYHLSIHFLRLGKYVKRKDPLYIAGKPEVKKLAEQTGEYVHLMTERNDKLVYLHGEQGEDAVGEEFFTQKFVIPGKFHSMACGKALLAFLPQEKQDRIIEEADLKSHTEKTITSKEELRNNLEEIREQGFAVNDEEEILGAYAVGSPIFDRSGTVPGAISITKPKNRADDDEIYERVPEQIMRTANEIEINLQTRTEHDQIV